MDGGSQCRAAQPSSQLYIWGYGGTDSHKFQCVQEWQDGWELEETTPDAHAPCTHLTEHSELLTGVHQRQLPAARVLQVQPHPLPAAQDQALWRCSGRTAAAAGGCGLLSCCGCSSLAPVLEAAQVVQGFTVG